MKNYLKGQGLNQEVKMSFRIEEKLYIKSENLIQFQEFLKKNKSVRTIHHPRIIESLYFENLENFLNLLPCYLKYLFNNYIKSYN